MLELCRLSECVWWHFKLYFKWSDFQKLFRAWNLQALRIPVEMVEVVLAMKNLQAKETRQHLFGCDGQGISCPKATKKSCQCMDQNCALWISILYFLNWTNPNRSFCEPQLSGPQTLNETDVFHEVWGFVTGDFHAFNTQIYTCSSNYKG